jgi:hypothetical protein
MRARHSGVPVLTSSTSWSPSSQLLNCRFFSFVFTSCLPSTSIESRVYAHSPRGRPSVEPTSGFFLWPRIPRRRYLEPSYFAIDLVYHHGNRDHRSGGGVDWG